MTNAQLIAEKFKALDGKTFKTREDLDNEAYFYFGSLSSIFYGETFRDVVDRMINARWIDNVNGEWIVQLPKFDETKALPTLDSKEFIKTEDSDLELSFLKLIKLNKGLILFPEVMQEPISELLRKKLIYFRESEEFLPIINLAKECIEKLDYAGAIIHLQNVQKQKGHSHPTCFITELGLATLKNEI